MQLGGCHSSLLFPRQIRANTISFTVFPEIVPSIGNSFINTMKNRSEERFSRNAETDLVCRLLLEKKKKNSSTRTPRRPQYRVRSEPYPSVHKRCHVVSDSFSLLYYLQSLLHIGLFFFFFTDTATPEIYTLSLHDALPIWLFPRQIRANTISFTVFPEIVPSIGNSFINTMKNINHTRSSISDDIRNILCSSANMRRAIPLILRLLMN